jgi:hypothetical protein
MGWQHPYLRLTRIVRSVLNTHWDDTTWPTAKKVVRDAITARARLARAGWFN